MIEKSLNLILEITGNPSFDLIRRVSVIRTHYAIYGRHPRLKASRTEIKRQVSAIPLICEMFIISRTLVDRRQKGTQKQTHFILRRMAAYHRIGQVDLRLHGYTFPLQHVHEPSCLHSAYITRLQIIGHICAFSRFQSVYGCISAVYGEVIIHPVGLHLPVYDLEAV